MLLKVLNSRKAFFFIHERSEFFLKFVFHVKLYFNIAVSIFFLFKLIL